MKSNSTKQDEPHDVKNTTIFIFILVMAVLAFIYVHINILNTDISFICLEIITIQTFKILTFIWNKIKFNLDFLMLLYLLYIKSENVEPMTS